MHAQSCSRVRLFATPRTVAHQAPLSMRFSRQEYWSGLLFPSPGDLPHPGIEAVSLECSALAGGFFTTAPPPPPHCLFFPKRHPARKSDVELSLEMAEGVAREFLSFLPFSPVPALPGALLFPSPHLGPCIYVCTPACVLTCLHVCVRTCLHMCFCMKEMATHSSILA